MDTQKPDRTNRPKPTWTKAQTFTDTTTGISAVVSKSDGRFPMYSVVIGRVRDDGSVNANIPMRENREAPGLMADYGVVIGSLMADADAYITQELVVAADMRKAFNADRPDRGPRPGGDRRDGPKGPAIHRPGKTARDRAKRPGGGAK